MISARASMSTRHLRPNHLDTGGGGGGEQDLAFAAAIKRLHKSPEPTSVLYHCSPSADGSSSSAGTAPDPPLISAEDWEAVLSGDMAAPATQPQDSSFLRWIMDAGYADGDGDAFGFKVPAFGEEEPPFLPPPAPPQVVQVQEALLLPAAAQAAGEDLEPQAPVHEILEAARCADAGDFPGARRILARLNHRLPSSPPLLLPGHPPLLRAAAHLRDALLRVLPPAPALPPGSGVASPLDVALKLAAHKALADASPTVQFAGFTSTQAFLDALGGARRVHVVDFDVGFGGHWPPLMQELAHQWARTAAPLPPPSLKVTALVSPGSRHPLELHLTHESLTRFAADLGIPFEFSAVVFDPLDPSPPMGLSAAPDEAVAVHLPVGSGTFSPAPASLHVAKQLRPAIVVCVDHGCDRGDMPLPHHALNLLRSCAALLESLDAAGASPDVVSKIEQFILRPRVEHLVLGGDKLLPPWQSMFVSAGFAPVQLSNAAEAQAECLLRRTASHQGGFHVEKRQAALALWWQRSELVSVSAWRC